jgi:hypothetical protein
MAPARKERKGTYKTILGVMDYLRYLYPEYKNADMLRKRIELKIPSSVRAMIKVVNAIAGTRGADFLMKRAVSLEKSIPSDKTVEGYIVEKNPDLMLVTPLVDYASDQTDYVKSAKALGVKSALCVASWDNLTNKGLMRVRPDAVIVWNEKQKAEAIELHGVDASKVIVTGAQCFDKWFDRQPSVFKEDFVKKVGLEPDGSYILYLCSSPFIAPDEVGFVRGWIEQLRSSGDQVLNNIGILVRPHPQNAKQWNDVDFSCFNNVVIYPRAGANPVEESSMAEFYDSMYYSKAVVGINTSAMIESGILSKPVLTVRSPEFKGTQDGTLHFHHLTNGGLLYVADDLKTHCKQLSKILAGGESYEDRIKGFIKDFIRPHGLDVRCTPVVVQSIEDLVNNKAKSSIC